MNNFKKVVTMVLAFAIVLTCVMVTPAQAAGKLNKATASIYAGETVQLKAKVKSVTWGSSNKKVAKVSKTGLVTGVKKGTCTITAKDNKTKTAYKCKVTVKAAKNFGFKAKDIFVYTGGNVISYPGKEIKGATYVLDGKKLTKKNYSTWTDKDGDGYVSTGITLTKKLTDGKHTFAIQKKGYKTVTKTFEFKAVKADGMFIDGEDPWVEDGTLYLLCNPKLDGKDFVVKVDGTEVKPTDAFTSGDGYFVIWVDATSITAGEHTVTVTSEGLPDGEATFTVK
jgi:hypothetical protein